MPQGDTKPPRTPLWVASAVPVPAGLTEQAESHSLSVTVGKGRSTCPLENNKCRQLKLHSCSQGIMHNSVLTEATQTLQTKCAQPSDLRNHPGDAPLQGSLCHGKLRPSARGPEPGKALETCETSELLHQLPGAVGTQVWQHHIQLSYCNTIPSSGAPIQAPS